MRAHGVPNYPDPSAGRGGVQIAPGSGLNPRSPAFESAQKTCAKLEPDSGGPPPAMTASQHRAALAFSQCMRTHGLPDFPDPLASDSGAPTSAPSLSLRGMQFPVTNGLNPMSPAFRRAAAACKLKLP